MRKGYELGGKYAQDPIGSEKPRGKASSQRRHRNDPGFTPTESRKREALLRQFMRTGEGPGGSTPAYKDNYAATFGHD